MIRALLRAPSFAMEDGERTHLERSAIDMALAVRQHAAYAAALAEAGADVAVLPADDALADSAFVEDVALAFPELCVVLRPGAVSRRPEVETVAAALPDDRPAVRLARGAMDGGDVLVVDRRVFVGLSPRTDDEGLAALAETLRPQGYSVEGVDVPGALHLKTAVTALDAETLAINPLWVDPLAFAGFRTLTVAEDEPFAANTLTVGGRLFVQAAAPRTAERLAAAGYAPIALDIREFAKAEAGLTCLSLIFPATG